MDNIVFLCLLVFFARIVDTSLSTLATVFIVKDRTVFAVLMSFIQVFVWFIVVREALNSADSAFLLAGYACGVMVGMYLSDKYIVSNVSVNIVVKQKKEVVDALINHNFAVSVSRVKGKDLISNKYMIFVATTNKKLPLLKKLVTEIDSHAFIVVSENKYVVGGYK